MHLNYSYCASITSSIVRLNTLWYGKRKEKESHYWQLTYASTSEATTQKSFWRKRLETPSNAIMKHLMTQWKLIPAVFWDELQLTHKAYAFHGPIIWMSSSRSRTCTWDPGEKADTELCHSRQCSRSWVENLWHSTCYWTPTPISLREHGQSGGSWEFWSKNI